MIKDTMSIYSSIRSTWTRWLVETARFRNRFYDWCPLHGTYIFNKKNRNFEWKEIRNRQLTKRRTDILTNQSMGPIFFVHQTIHLIVEYNAKKLHKVNKKLGKIIKVFKGFRTPKQGGHRHFLKKTPGNHQGVGIW